MNQPINKLKIGVVSGYFNPLHIGHIEYINAAKDQCDYLIAVVNSDLQVELKKSKPFMNQGHRKFIVENLKSVDESIISVDLDKTQCATLKMIRELNLDFEIYFFNSGDRKVGNLASSESETCKQNNILEIILDLPKICSSSELLKL